jgi:regulator of sigma E protease
MGVLSFLPSGVVTALTFLFVLGVLIFVHEFGHFLVARLHGVRVLRFSLGFDPRIFTFRRGGTEYSVGVIPLGGFVKLAGETVEENRTGAPDEFLSKSKWVRAQVYLAGPAMNLLLAWLVLGGVLARGADEPIYWTSAPVIGKVRADSPAARAGIQIGDVVQTVNGVPTPTWESFGLAVASKADQPLSLSLRRDGGTVDVNVTPEAVGRYEIGDLGVQPVLRPQISQVTAGGPADQGGLRSGDVVLAVGGQTELDRQSVIDRIKGSAGRPLEFQVERAGTPMTLSVVPSDAGLIGVALYGAETRRIDPTLGRALVLSAQQNWEMTVAIGTTIRDLITRDAKMNQLMGPIMIADMSGSAAQVGLLEVLRLMAGLSLNLALLNLLPIPVLDGGHIAILAAEGVARRDLSVRLKERILLAGAALIILLMVTVIYNDVMRLLR